jgi:hypothetical protein
VQCSPAPPRPPLLPQQQPRAPCSPDEQGLALHLRQELFDSGGWATTPSGFPHRVPLAFVALISGLRRRHLLQARKVHRQQANLSHEYPTTLLKMAHLWGRALGDLQLLRHALAGRIARLPRWRGQTSL